MPSDGLAINAEAVRSSSSLSTSPQTTKDEDKDDRKPI